MVLFYVFLNYCFKIFTISFKRAFKSPAVLFRSHPSQKRTNSLILGSVARTYLI